VGRRCAAAIAIVALLFGTGARLSDASPDPQYTQLILHMNAASSVTLDLVTDATATCSLINSGTAAAALDLGAATSSTQSSCVGSSGYTAGNTYKLQTAFNVYATCTNGSSSACGTKYTLTAALQSTAQTSVTWHYGGNTMSTTPTTIGNLTYGVDHAKNIVVDVKTNGGSPATSNIQQTLVFTATDTTTPALTASATLNVEFINAPGISIFFSKDGSGAAMTGGAFSASMDLGNVFAYGTLTTPGVTLAGISPSTYTIQTYFDVNVEMSGFISSNYTLSAALASTAPTGLTYVVDGVTLSMSPSSITSAGSYGSAAPHALQLVISRSGSGSGGPSINTPLSDTLDFTATSN
jgi:hypothetical protein